MAKPGIELSSGSYPFDAKPLLILSRRALLEKWREKCGSRATYRNLVKLFYNAKKISLAEAVCEVGGTHISSTNTSQCVCSQRRKLVATSQTYKYYMLCVFAVASLLLALYINQTANLHTSNDFTFQTDELGRPLYSHKAGRIAVNNLPHLPGPFVGRDNDVNDIINLLLHSLVKSVHIVGLPAVGKSTLAVHVGYEMASRGVAVRYINVDETHVFKSRDECKAFDCTEKPKRSDDHSETTQEVTPTTSQIFGDIALSWYSHSESKFVSTTALGLIEWAKGLSNLTLLILDNCDFILQGKSHVFMEVFDALNKASPYLCTVTTSRLKLKLLDAKPYKLKPLDNDSAIELLQLVSPTMTLNESRTINELLDGIPLALKIVGSLVSEERPPNAIIRELQQNVIETLTPEDVRPETQKMRPVLRLSYNYLDNDTQECALYLSHFPGSFSQEAALHILSNCNNRTPLGCLKTLTDISLLDLYSYAGQTRYQFHTLIKEYLTDIESQNNQIDKISFRFNSSFGSYYTYLLHKFASTYNRNPHDEENIGRFEYESHNFEHLLDKVDFLCACAVKSIARLSYALKSELMLNMFTKVQLLRVAQTLLVMFEQKMDDISTKFGALETMNLYRDLVVAIKKWIQPEKYCCMPLCQSTFLQGFGTRFKIINNQLAKTNHNSRKYKELQFPYFAESICLSHCSHFATIDISMTTVCVFVMLTVTMVQMVVGKRCVVRKIQCLLIAIFCLCFVFFDVSIAASVCVFICVAIGLKFSGLLKLMKNHHLTVIYYSMFVAFVIGKNMIATIYIFSYVMMVNACNLFCTKSVTRLNDALHISTIVWLVNTYVYEFEILDYVNSSILAFIYPYLEFIAFFVLFHIILNYTILMLSHVSYTTILEGYHFINNWPLYLGLLIGIVIVLSNSLSETATFLFQLFKFFVLFIVLSICTMLHLQLTISNSSH